MNESLIKNILRTNKSRHIFRNDNSACKCYKPDWNTTSETTTIINHVTDDVTTSVVTDVVTGEVTDVVTGEVTDVVTDDNSDVTSTATTSEEVTDESMTTTKPKYFSQGI